MTETREFHIGDVITVTTGLLVAPRHIDAIYDLCNFMTGESLMTHQLPRASRECEPTLREQHPDLCSEIAPPISSWEEAEAWLSTLYPKYGEMVTVRPLDSEDHTRIDPISEIKLRYPELPMIVVLVEEVE